MVLNMPKKVGFSVDCRAQRKQKVELRQVVWGVPETHPTANYGKLCEDFQKLTLLRLLMTFRI